MNDVERTLAGKASCEAPDAPQGGEVLECIRDRPLVGATRLVTVNRHTLDFGKAAPVALLAGRADDRDLIAGAGESGALVPDVSVGWNRLVLEQDQDAFAIHGHAPTGSGSSNTPSADDCA